MERRFIASLEDEGERLDACLARWMGISRRRAAAAIEADEVRVAGRRAPKGRLLQAGEEVVVRLALELSPVPEARPLVVRYEDETLLVVDKPSGIFTHPLVAGETGTLANAVVAHAPSCASASTDPREGGAAHRLDRETSGLVLFVKERPAWERLRRAFSERTVHKEYLALVRGEMRDREIRSPIAPPVKGRARVARPSEEGREAVTLVRALRAVARPGGGRWTLVRCTIPTGVMHQIRVHLDSVGHPIAGDPLYGNARFPGLDRLFLHASALAFSHPKSGARLRIDSPLPPELRGLVEPLASSSKSR